MKRGIPSSSRPSLPQTKQFKLSTPVDDVDATDLAAFRSDLNRIRSSVRQRDELNSPGIKSPGTFATILEALQYLRSLVQSLPLLTCSKKPLPPIIWKHHLYALFSNHTQVDTELKSLCESDQIRILCVATSTRNGDIIIQIDDYSRYFLSEKRNLLIELFISKMVKAYTKTKYTLEELNRAGFGESAIQKFVQLGLLTTTDSSLSHRQLSFPGLGVYVRTLHQGRKALLTFIRKCKYSQSLQSDLLKRPIPKCSTGNDTLGIELHLYDIFGADLVVQDRLATDVMIRVIAT